MKNLETRLYLKAVGAKKLLNNERGAQSLEWLGIAALLIMVIGIISTFLGNNESRITDIIGNILDKIEEQIG